ncbi:MAG: Rieske (2Fe-2S) protein [Candidatus Korobacteraceae bacterium]
MPEQTLRGKDASARIRRRRFLGNSLLLMVVGLGKRLWSQAIRFCPLARPVVVPLNDLATPWRARQFMADGVTLASAATPNQPIRVSGMVLRTAKDDNQPQRFSAVCLRCPHEGCDVDFVPDPKTLPQEVKDEIGEEIADSVYVCPCHNSTFKAETGERLAGPAPRGLYLFRVTGVSETFVEIAEVEEDVLIFVQ